MTGADAEPRSAPARARPTAPAPELHPTAGARDAQPAFPWSTEEFVAGRDDVDERPSGPRGRRAGTSARLEPAGAVRRSGT